MKILVIAEDLRISGTSEGQVSRSFIYNLSLHPKVESIDLLYFKCDKRNHLIEKLNVQKSWVHYTPALGGKFIKFWEKVWHKVFGQSLIDNYKITWMKKKLRSFDFSCYNRIFVRSTGQSFLTIRASSVLKGLEHKTTLYFHDSYPFFWDPGFAGSLNKLAVNSYLEMRNLLHQGFTCTSPASYLGRDLRFLYGIKKPFHTIPHQFVSQVFDIPKEVKLEGVENKIVVMYHGAIQLGRTIEPFLKAFQLLCEENEWFNNNVLLILRIKGDQETYLKNEYKDFTNIWFLGHVDAGTAYQEIAKYSHLNLILEPSGCYSNILVGKAPLLSSLNKPVFILGPDDSELKHLISNKDFFSHATSVNEIKDKFLQIVIDISNESYLQKDCFDGYFTLQNFFNSIDNSLHK